MTYVLREGLSGTIGSPISTHVARDQRQSLDAGIELTALSFLLRKEAFDRAVTSCSGGDSWLSKIYANAIDRLELYR